ncbi:uncharacterized protein LOC124202367 [Daphnia pulex]|uniref:uncharacterized protein LOC124202367 n=1 Tax=Daphnia pulex TaxID=6669 RepID=UPI001EDCC480|nr:uncharacterized protein LOC124202367 [Daphnia pulex]
MFKLSWLENEEQYNRAKSLLIYEFNRVKGSIAVSISSQDSSDGTSSSRSDPSPEKCRKNDFFSSITKKISKEITNDELNKYLNFCQTLDQLQDYPTMTSIYKRFNVTLPSSAAVERLFIQGGLIFTPKRLKLTDLNFEMLVFLKVNHAVFKEW